MHLLLRCNINAGVHACAQSGRVTQRCHNRNSRWETGLGSANDVTQWKRVRRILGILKKVSWVEFCLGRRRLAFASSPKPGQWPLWWVQHVLGGGRWKSQNRKNVYLSPYVEEPLNWKVIKSFVPELKVFLCFEIPMFNVYMLWTLYVRFVYWYHGYGTYIP